MDMFDCALKKMEQDHNDVYMMPIASKDHPKPVSLEKSKDTRVLKTCIASQND